MRRVPMRVTNVHSRFFSGTGIEQGGGLIDSLAGPDDRLWPQNQVWPPVKFDQSLGVGATGGQGPIHYRVEQYEPTRRVRFAFITPKGFNGYHEWEALPGG